MARTMDADVPAGYGLITGMISLDVDWLNAY